MRRIATTDDLGVLARLQRDFYAEDAIPHRAEVERALATLLAEPAVGRVIVEEDHAADTRAIVGYVVMTFGFCLELGGRDAFVDELYVAPSHRRRGLGRALLLEGITLATREGASTVHLEVAAADEAKLRLYESAGFRPRPYPLMTRRT
ncbi:MAG: GNAT family N-acetyltransferase [Deltaproteobacteria bacterium]|nr:GNAT family N-acetyltransferase [Deltaproteobacteria bacterium]